MKTKLMNDHLKTNADESTRERKLTNRGVQETVNRLRGDVEHAAGNPDNARDMAEHTGLRNPPDRLSRIRVLVRPEAAANITHEDIITVIDAVMRSAEDHEQDKELTDGNAPRTLEFTDRLGERFRVHVKEGMRVVVVGTERACKPLRNEPTRREAEDQDGMHMACTITSPAVQASVELQDVQRTSRVFRAATDERCSADIQDAGSPPGFWEKRVDPRGVEYVLLRFFRSINVFVVTAEEFDHLDVSTLPPHMRQGFDA